MRFVSPTPKNFYENKFSFEANCTNLQVKAGLSNYKSVGITPFVWKLIDRAHLCVLGHDVFYQGSSEGGGA